MSKVLFTLLLRYLPFVFIGAMIGAFVYKLSLKKELNAMAVEVLSDIIEDRGFVTFVDNTFAIHCLTREAFGSLMTNILESSKSNTIM